MRFLKRLKIGIKKLGPVNKTLFYFTIAGFVCTFIFAVFDLFYFSKSANEITVRTEFKQIEKRNILNNVPLTDITIGVDTRGTETISSMMEIIELPVLELSIDRKSYINIAAPNIVKYQINQKLKVNWKAPFQIKFSISDQVKNFPATIGELIGHEIKLRENDPRPLINFSRIGFFHRLNAIKPFLILQRNNHEYVGGYYMRVWYPNQKNLVFSSDGEFRDHSPFVVTHDILNLNFEY